MSRFALFGPASLLLGACVPDTSDIDTPTPTPPTAPATEVHWAYDGEHGPETWSEQYPECAGSEQSPIDLTGNESEGAGPMLTFQYSTSTLDAENNGHTVVFHVNGANTLDIDGVTYTLAQFHFHAQSEHTIGGEHFPLEMHLVHLNGDEIAVVGVFLDEGPDADPWFEAARWSELPVEGGDVLADPATVLDLDGFALTLMEAEATDYTHYPGSLTTPGCAEGVRWFVLGQPKMLSDAQIASFTDIYDHNFRPVQPLGARVPIWDSAFGL